MKITPKDNLRKKRTVLFRSAEVLIVGFWLVMMALLLYRDHFDKTTYSIDNTGTVHKKAGSRGPDQEWMEIFLRDRKIGYSHSTLQPLQGGYVVHETLFLRLNLLGRPSLVRSETHALLDGVFHLKNFKFSIQSGVTSFSVQGEVKDRWLMIRRRGSPEKKIHLKEPLSIGSSLSYIFKKEPLGIGKSFRIAFFDPSTLARKPMVIRVTGRKSISIHGIPYRAYHLETRLMGQDMSFWVNENGDLLKESGLMGMRLVRSNSSRATKDITGTGGEEFYELASVKSDRRLPLPRELRYLKVRLAGIDKTPFSRSSLNGGRQQYRQGVLEITRETVPPAGSSFFSRETWSAGMKRYLQPELNIESDDPGIRRAARKIARGEQDPVLVARRLLTWVYGKIDKRPIMAVPSAREVLKTRVGDCNEHAVLLTALLRAAGIPARVCAGLVYARGKFYYHAWTECWLGQWISLDATLNQMPADATHIVLARGSLENQTAIIALMGKLKIKVVTYRSMKTGCRALEVYE